MSVYQDDIKGVNVLFQAIETDDIANQSGTSPNYEPSDLKDIPADVYNKLKQTVTHLALDMGENFQAELSGESSPATVEIELSLAFSKEYKVWITGGKGEFGIKVKMTWNLKEQQ